jgi:ureidoacrylate peracid hydrolase
MSITLPKNILVLIDIQKEYVTAGRPFYLSGIEPSLENSRQLLAFARKNDWEIIHIQHSNGEAAERFNPKTEYFDFVNGFNPIDSEKHFVKMDFSCYSSPEFSTYLSELFLSKQPTPNIYLIGYNTVMCCLSTLEEARRKKHKMHLVKDATLAKAIANVTEKDMHEIMLGVYAIKGLASLVATEEIIRQQEF